MTGILGTPPHSSNAFAGIANRITRVDPQRPLRFAARIRELLSDRIDNGMLAFESIVLKARRSQK